MPFFRFITSRDSSSHINVLLWSSSPAAKSIHMQSRFVSISFVSVGYPSIKSYRFCSPHYIQKEAVVLISLVSSHAFKCGFDIVIVLKKRIKTSIEDHRIIYIPSVVCAAEAKHVSFQYMSKH